MKESLKKIEELKNQLNAVKSELQNEFKAELKKIFVDNPTLDSVEMYLNNHEFNVAQPHSILDMKISRL